MDQQQFDVIVIGAGPAGEVLAGRVAERGGRRVALVERELVGGECSYYACMPSKALLRPQELLAETRRVPGLAAAGDGGLDVPAVLARRDEVISDRDDSGQLPWLEERGVTLVRGHGRLDGERRVRVGDDLLEAREAVVLATGSGATLPPIPGLADAEPWTNREITTTSEVPEHLVVLGGGVVGVEMAQAWRSLGARVTIVEALDRLIAREEPHASAELAAAFAEQGIDVRAGARASRVTREGTAPRGGGGDDDARTATGGAQAVTGAAPARITVHLEDGGAVTGDRLLVAIGRRPHSDDVGLESVGLEPGEPVAVGADLRAAGRDWLYAIGDVNGHALLTHMGKEQARLAADHILGRAPAAELGEAALDGARAPRVIFTDPQVAAVGHTLASAREAGVAARAIDLPTSSTAGASFYGRGAPGTTRFVIDDDARVLVGATFVGADVNELLHAATIAVRARVPLDTLAHAVAPFPTRTELWLRFAEAAGC